MAIAYGGADSAAATSTDNVACSVSPAGSDLMLVASGSNSSGGGGANGTLSSSQDGTLTELDDTVFETFAGLVVGYKVGPSTGATTITYQAAATKDELAVGAEWFTGAAQSAPTNHGGTSGSGATSLAHTLTSPASTSYLAGTVYAQPFGTAQSVSGTGHAYGSEEEAIGGFCSYGISYRPASDGSDITYTVGSSTEWHRVYAVELTEAAAGGGVTPKLHTLLGIGK